VNTITIITTIRHELDLNRAVSASSNSLFKIFLNSLPPFCLQFSIIFGILLVILVTCPCRQFDLFFSVLSTGSTLNSSNISPFFGQKVCILLFRKISSQVITIFLCLTIFLP
jgi:hypothetical protein